MSRAFSPGMAVFGESHCPSRVWLCCCAMLGLQAMGVSALTYFVMQGRSRDSFLNYIKQDRDLENLTTAATVEKADTEALLTSSLKIDVNTFEAPWKKFIGHL
jgi:hypothetical protein